MEEAQLTEFEPDPDGFGCVDAVGRYTSES